MHFTSTFCLHNKKQLAVKEIFETKFSYFPKKLSQCLLWSFITIYICRYKYINYWLSCSISQEKTINSHYSRSPTCVNKKWVSYYRAISVGEHILRHNSSSFFFNTIITLLPSTNYYIHQPLLQKLCLSQQNFNGSINRCSFIDLPILGNYLEYAVQK